MKTKTIKKTKKVTKKPDFVVDWTNVETYLDIPYETAQGKIRAGLPISQEEADVIEKMGFMTAADIVDTMLNEAEKHTTYIEDDELADKLIKEIKKYTIKKKQPWYKRFWRWITFRSNK